MTIISILPIYYLKSETKLPIEAASEKAGIAFPFMAPSTLYYQKALGGDAYTCDFDEDVLKRIQESKKKVVKVRIVDNGMAVLL